MSVMPIWALVGPVVVGSAGSAAAIRMQVVLLVCCYLGRVEDLTDDVESVFGLALTVIDTLDRRL